MKGNARDLGVLDQYADGFAAWLSARGYSPSTVGKQLTLMGRLGWQREITVRGKAGKDRIVRIGHQTALNLDRYLRARSRHGQAWRPQLWLGAGNREPLTAAGIYQMTARRGRQCGVDAYPHRFRHHFSHT
jgi:site-specific recombinase XerD